MLKNQWMPNTAVLLACFNRKENTINCLSQLLNLTKDIDVYVVDDNSTDGTAESIHSRFPEVRLIEGSGNLFWNRGMNLAWQQAATRDYEFYLWLNDDVILYENCLKELYECSNISNNKAIISGIVESEDKLQILYGGTNDKKKILKPNGKLNPITRMNGNVVLIPKSVYKSLGNLDPFFHHDLGDVDYGLRAKKNNISVFTTRVAIAFGLKNELCRVRLNKTTVYQRFKHLYTPLGSPPLIDFYFRKRHFGIINASINFVFLHFLNAIPDRMNETIFGKKYI